MASLHLPGPWREPRSPGAGFYQQVRLLAPPWCPGNYSPPATFCTVHFIYNKDAKHISSLGGMGCGVIPLAGDQGFQLNSQRVGTPLLPKDVRPPPQLPRCTPGHLQLLFLGSPFQLQGKNCCQSPDAPLPNNYTIIS